MILRLAEPKEIKKVWNIRNKSIRYKCVTCYSEDTIWKWTPDKIPDSFYDLFRNNSIFVVEINNRIVSTGFLQIEEYTVGGMHTLPRYMGKGYASAIMNAIKELAKKSHLEYLKLEATPVALDFYKKHGFIVKEIGQHWSPILQNYIECIHMIHYL